MTATANPERRLAPAPSPARRRPTWVRLAGPMLALLIAGLAVGRFLWAGSSITDEPAPRVALATDIESLRARTVAEPASADAWLAYGLTAMRTAIATGDPSYYGTARVALDRALALSPTAADTLAARAGLALSLHDFAEALPLAERAVDGEPTPRRRPRRPVRRPGRERGLRRGRDHDRPSARRQPRRRRLRPGLVLPPVDRRHGRGARPRCSRRSPPPDRAPGAPASRPSSATSSWRRAASTRPRRPTGVRWPINPPAFRRRSGPPGCSSPAGR